MTKIELTIGQIGAEDTRWQRILLAIFKSEWFRATGSPHQFPLLRLADGHCVVAGNPPMMPNRLN